MHQQETTNARMTAIFNEWARQYAEDPESFGKVLDANGRPLPDYGSVCTAEFNRIAAEMDARGALPVPSAA